MVVSFQVLEQSAQLALLNGDYPQAIALRQELRSLQPNSVDPLLHLMLLAMHGDGLSKSAFMELDLVAKIAASVRAKTPVEEMLVLQALEKFLEEPFLDMVTAEFVSACGELIQDRENFVAVVFPAATRLGYVRGWYGLAAALVDVCLEVTPGNMILLMQLPLLCQKAGIYDRGVSAARQCLQIADNDTDRLNASYMLLRGLLNTGGDWNESMAMLPVHRSRLAKLITNNPILPQADSRRILPTAYLLPYMEDQPAQNHRLQNQLIAVSERSMQIYAQEPYERYQASHRVRKASPQPRKLKVGYICHCFHSHSVGWLARWLLKYHNPAQVELFAYMVNPSTEADPVRDQYRQIVPNLRECGCDGLEIAEQIHQDGIDILVDLDSLTLDVTCEIMALKPAPIQVTWLGWDASGFSTIDYYLADRYVLPDDAQDYYVEEIWRLPTTYLAVDGFEVGEADLTRSMLNIAEDAVVFYSGQRGYKRHRETTLWQLQIVSQVPKGIFLVKGLADEAAVKAFFYSLADEVGLEHDRLRFAPQAASEEIHRANLAIADIVLDTFPYNGATTTMEALWMERPLVTLVGEQFAARNSYTMLINAGVEEGIAWSPEEYIEWGVRLGQDASLRAGVRAKLRQSKANKAPLWNGQQFAQDVEIAYQEMARRFWTEDDETAVQIRRDRARHNPLATPSNASNIRQPSAGKIILDGAFFQLYDTGVGRLWQSLLAEWSQGPFSSDILVLDRAGTCPKIPGINYRTLPLCDYGNLEAEGQFLQTICDEENAALFISTYYTKPALTPSIFMGYDMIPEVLGADLSDPMWQSKHHAIRQAAGHITISQNTARDLYRYFPEIDQARITPILCGVSNHFGPASEAEILQFRHRYNIQKPYFLLVGPGFVYKNSELFLAGLSQLCSRRGFDVICTGSSALDFSATARQQLPEMVFHPLYLDDDELRLAYAGAIALVYPSKYEGFGLPVVEAMKCGCPVITCRNASIPEVAGDAAMYIADNDANAMAEALLEVQKPQIRQQLIKAGYQQAAKFSWATMAQEMQRTLSAYLEQVVTQGSQILVLVDWTQPEAELYQHLLAFFRFVAAATGSETFLIDTTGTDPESASMMIGGVLMDYLMMEEANLEEEPSIQFIDPITAESIVGLNLSAQIVLGEISAEIVAMLQGIPVLGT
jgi:predicted O-linked N-acetylglucosamine transferase (SPINDLY family)